MCRECRQNTHWRRRHPRGRTTQASPPIAHSLLVRTTNTRGGREGETQKPLWHRSVSSSSFPPHVVHRGDRLWAFLSGATELSLSLAVDRPPATNPRQEGGRNGDPEMLSSMRRGEGVSLCGGAVKCLFPPLSPGGGGRISFIPGELWPLVPTSISAAAATKEGARPHTKCERGYEGRKERGRKSPTLDKGMWAVAAARGGGGSEGRGGNF